MIHGCDGEFKWSRIYNRNSAIKYADKYVGRRKPFQDSASESKYRNFEDRAVKQATAMPAKLMDAKANVLARKPD